MRKLLLICAAIVLVACVSAAYAEVQNVKVSGDIAVTGVFRDEFRLGQPGLTQYEASDVIMSQARVRVDADLTDNVSTSIRLINERDWNKEEDSDDDTDIDLDLAYITLKEMIYSPLTLTLGRQNLRFGNGFIIGDPDTNRKAGSSAATPIHPSNLTNQDLSVRKAFDAIRATLNYDPLTIDLIYSKIDENSTVSNPARDDVDLYGINANYELGDNYGTVAEVYYFAKRDDSTNAQPTVGGRADTVYTPGLRISTNPIENLNLQGEVAWQFGEKHVSAGNMRHREAMAAQVMANYALKTDMNPTLGVVVSLYTGDKDAANRESVYAAWDPMFEDQTAGSIINVLFDATNARVLNLKGSLEPMEDVKLALDYVMLWLDKNLHVGKYGATSTSLFSLYGISGTSTNPSMTGDDVLGQEIDLALTYDYTEDVQLGLLYGYFIPGDAFSDLNRQNATEVIASCKVAF